MTAADLVTVEARVLEYVADAMTDHYDDESFAVFDATVLRVEAPARLAGQILSILHDQQVPRESVWRASGRRVRFVVAERDLAELDVLFTGAIQQLTELP